MAHFALVDENNVVVQVVVISNADMIDANGIEQESLGIELCQTIVGPGRWIQTSYNGSFRGHFASPGTPYSESLDRFAGHKPFASWILDGNFDWVPPVAFPSDFNNNYRWDETVLGWVSLDS